MASTKAYLDFVLEQLSELEGVSYRAMMGEYVIYCRGKVIGGVYDDRFLIKPTPTALRLLEESGLAQEYDIPYPGARELLIAPVDERALLGHIVGAIANELPNARR